MHKLQHQDLYPGWRGVEEVEEERTRTGSCPGHSSDCGSCDWTGSILLMFCACLVYILCSVLNSGKEGSKVYRHFCPACNALVGEYNPKRRAAWMYFWFFIIFVYWIDIFYIRWLTNEYVFENIQFDAYKVLKITLLC